MTDDFDDEGSFEEEAEESELGPDERAMDYEILNEEEEAEDGDGLNEDIYNNPQDNGEEDVYEKFIKQCSKPLREVGIPYNKLYDFSDYDVFEGKLGNLVSIQPKEFNDFYEPEKSNKLIDEKGKEVEKSFPFDNFIRWKYADSSKVGNKDKDEVVTKLNNLFNISSSQSKTIISNTKIIEWSDGSFQLLIGSNYFDIIVNESANARLTVEHKDDEHIHLIQDKIRKKMIVRQSLNTNHKRRESISHEDLKILTESNQESNRIKTFHSYFDKNKFTREEYMSKSNKFPSAKSISKTKQSTGSGMTSKKRVRSDSN